MNSCSYKYLETQSVTGKHYRYKNLKALRFTLEMGQGRGVQEDWTNLEMRNGNYWDEITKTRKKTSEKNFKQPIDSVFRYITLGTIGPIVGY